ncbi:plasmid mobilization protein [Nocardioides aurantiacus]|uniref:plasmid mobilization protein n=1 Tax=Nocardioides aurantiacus TaxID=86796 RepID=UPI00403FAB72
MTKKSEAEFADYYDKTEDVSEFDPEHPESLTVRRNVTISVRFSDGEISELRARAERAGVKVTSFIRAAALEATSPVDREALGGLVRDLERRAHDIAAMIGRTPPTGRQ